MTTLVGLVAGNGKKAVILGSDVSRTETQWKPQGDIAYKQQTRLEGQKIYVDDKEEAALCMSGSFDRAYQDLLCKILSGEINVKESIEKGGMQELLSMHLNRWEGRVPNEDSINGLLLATRYNNTPMLHTCWPLGKVEQRAWTSIGSGSNYAIEYIGRSGKLIPERVGMEEGIKLVVGALDRASQDIYTGGLDLVVLTEDKIYKFGEEIKNALARAKETKIKSIITRLR